MRMRDAQQRACSTGLRHFGGKTARADGCVAAPQLPAGEDGGEQRWQAMLRVLHGMQMGMPNYKDTHVQVGTGAARWPCCIPSSHLRCQRNAEMPSGPELGAGTPCRTSAPLQQPLALAC